MVTRLTTAYPLLPSLLAVKHWSKILSHAARDTTPIAPLMGEDENSSIQVKTETKKDKGDSVTFALLARLAADGFSEGQTAIGYAEAMTPLLAGCSQRDRHDLRSLVAELHRPPAHSLQPPRRNEGLARSVVW
jgi:hypothetical protein